MGLSQSHTSMMDDLETPPAHTPPHPSSSPLAAHTPSILSYFFPSSEPTHKHDHLPPTFLDIQLVTLYLTFLGLPPELVPRILDDADYLAACRQQITKRIVVRSTDARAHIDGSDGSYTMGQEDEVDPSAFGPDGGLRNKDGNVWYLLSSPIGCTGLSDTPDSSSEAVASTSTEYRKVWLRKVIIETLSRDQGWSSNNPQHYGTYESSFSWFEVSLLRGNHEVEGSRCSIQNNVHAGQYFKAHSNSLGLEHPTVKLAQPGDRMVLWVRAQYPGWRNHVNEAAITVFTSLYPPSS